MSDNDILQQILGTVQSMEKRLQHVETNMATREEMQDLVKEETKSLATQDMLKDLATKDMLEDLATKDMLENLATKDMLEDLATKDMLKDLATKDMLEDLATKDMLEDLATKDMLENLATKDMLEGLATKESQKHLATKADTAGLQQQMDSLQETVDRMERKQNVIQDQTGKLSEYHMHVTMELSEVKGSVAFHNHKLNDVERKLFKMKDSL
ncbi:hypothetical protein [Salibacterium halotolerans]|uniref:Uncharacterized protein n=1 Tax=Salibacterium halotolerans TaxID=1884432 RepID=A0A1I5VZ04_9BACI|nr:hypothetical protein [Salibacterium halotolerans]SFQ12768.1 hypothetical protein SAMN05518683_1187 [Salibacterium halotolerans]